MCSDLIRGLEDIISAGASRLLISGKRDIAPKIVGSKMIFRREGIAMGGIPGISEFPRKVADPGKIKKIIKILKML